MADKSKTHPAQKDIVIDLGRVSFKRRDVDYNVTEFLENIQSKSKTWISEVNEFTRALDKHVHIDPNDPRYKTVYQELRIIVDRIVKELKRSDPRFASAIVRPTGSIHCNVKVGLPHEADFVIEVDRPVEIDRKDELFGHFQASIKDIVLKMKDILTEGLGSWIIHGVESHTPTGTCLVMQYGDIGVTVDVVPAYRLTLQDMKKPKVGQSTLRRNAAEYLPYSFENYFERGDIHQLIASYKPDTGIIESGIVRDLPENKRSAFRVAKFLIQFFLGSGVHNYGFISSTTSARLYGYKPRIKSYHIRVCLLRLLFGTRGTAAAEQLTEGVLVLCLLDMIRHCYSTVETLGESHTDLKFKHPLLMNHDAGHIDRIDLYYSLIPVKERLDEIIQKYATTAPFTQLSYYELLNNKAPRLEGIM